MVENNIENLIKVLIADLDTVNALNDYVWENSLLETKASNNKNKASLKFSAYFNFKAPLKNIPYQKILVLFRARNANALKLQVSLINFDKNILEIFSLLQTKFNSPLYNNYLEYVSSVETFLDFWKELFPKIQTIMLHRLKRSADDIAIKAFTQTFKKLLNTKPIKDKIVIGLDCSSTGVNLVVIDQNANLLDTATIFPKRDWYDSITTLARQSVKYKANLISLGNSNGWREINRLLTEFITMYPDLNLEKIIVNDAGAHAYATSKIGIEEFSQLDPGFRRAISIAKRVQDPCGELLKINPKLIEVNVLQKDVNQKVLLEHFDEVIKQYKQKKQNATKVLTIKPQKKAAQFKKTMFNTSMRDALKKLNYGEN